MSISPALYGNLATLVVVGHFAFIVFVMFGGVLVARWPRAAWAHVPCFLWGGWIELSGGICPLTPLENRFRRAAGDSEYVGSFIEHYILPVMYPSGLTRSVQLFLAVGLVVLNVAIYAWVLRRRRAASRREAEGPSST